MVKSAFRFCCAIGALIAFAAGAADVRDGQAPDVNMTQPAAGPVYYVDRNPVTPAMGMYLSAVRDKVQRSATRDWPQDTAGKRIPGEVVVRITLRKDGIIEDVQASPVDGSASVRSDTLGAPVARLVKAAEPYAPFPPSLFADHETIVFTTTVGFARNTAHGPGEPRFGVDGMKNRMQLRSTIPF